MGAALLFWLKKYSDEEFCRAIGSMSYTQGLPTEQSAEAASLVEENDKSQAGEGIEGGPTTSVDGSKTAETGGTETAPAANNQGSNE